MTTTAMLNIKRQKPSVDTNTDLIKGFKKCGFNKVKAKVLCKVCEEELMDAAQTLGWTGVLPPWGNPYCAFTFKKGNKVINACRCGWREVVAKNVPTEKPKCSVRGCTSILCSHDTDGICTKCRKELEGGGDPNLWSENCTHKPKAGCFHYMQMGVEACVKCGVKETTQPTTTKKSNPNMGYAPKSEKNNVVM